MKRFKRILYNQPAQTITTQYEIKKIDMLECLT